MVSRLFWRFCWSNMTRLLNTPAIGPTANCVDSSRMDMPPGLSGELITKTPPRFCAAVGPATMESSAIAAAAARKNRDMGISPVAAFEYAFPGAPGDQVIVWSPVWRLATPAG